MYCPQCGQQQVSDSLRFCSRCGFPVEGVMRLLAGGGLLPYHSGPREASPRRKGVRQGALLFLLGMLVVPMLGILSSFAPGRIGVVFELFTALAAVICFTGGILRVLYAALFEEGARPVPAFTSPAYLSPPMTPTLNAPAGTALPPAFSQSPSSWNARRANTGELLGRPSVTENTTRLLDEKTESETG